MLLSSWVQSFRHSLKSKRRGTRRGFGARTQASFGLPGLKRTGRVESLEERALLTAFVIDQEFVNANPGLISVTNSTIDIDNDMMPDFDSIVVDSVTFDGFGGAGIDINLSNLTIDSISIDELSITGTAGSGVNITLDNMNVESLVIERSNVNSAVGGGINISANDTVLDELTLFQTNVSSGIAPGVEISLTSTTRNTVVDELDVSENTLDGLQITTNGIEKPILLASNDNPLEITSADHGFQDAVTVQVTEVQGNLVANTTDTIDVINDNLFSLENTDGTVGGLYTGGGIATLFTSINSGQILDNTITSGVAGTGGADGLTLNFTNTSAPGFQIRDNLDIRSIAVTLDRSPLDGFEVVSNMIDATERDALNFNLAESDLTNLVVDSNTFQGDGNVGGEGIIFVAADSNVAGRITGNTVDNTLGDALRFAGTVTDEFLAANGGPLLFDFQSDDNVIRDNTFSNNDGAGLFTNLIENTVLQADVFGNQFLNNQSRAIDFTAADTEDAFNLVIGSSDAADRNTIDNNTGGSIYISMEDTASGEFQILNNVITNTGGAGTVDAINVELIGTDVTFEATNRLKRSIIDGNLIGTSAVTQLASGITASQSVITVDDVSLFPATPFGIRIGGEALTVTNVTGNQFTVTRASGVAHDADESVVLTSGGNQGRGVAIHVTEMSRVEDLHISNNAIANNDDDGIKIHREDEGQFDAVNPLPGQDRAVTISNNVISGNAFNAPSEQIDPTTNIQFGAGIDILGQNGSIDLLDFEIRGNEIVANTGTNTRGISLRAEADTRMIVDIINNVVRFNSSDGIELTTRENSPTDLRQIAGTWIKNTISDNSGDGIEIAGRHGLVDPVNGATTPLFIGQDGVDPIDGLNRRNFIERNALEGIEIDRGGRTSIVNNLIAENGAEDNIDFGGFDLDPSGFNSSVFTLIRANEFTGNFGDAIDSFDNGTMVTITILDNLITENQTTNGPGDFSHGIELQAQGLTHTLINGNFIDSNGGRGVDLITAGNGELQVRVGDGSVAGRNTIVSNRLEGFHFLNTNSVNQTHDYLLTDPILLDGSPTSQNDTTLQLDTNIIRENGVGSAFDGTGLVLQVGTTFGVGGFLGATQDENGDHLNAGGLHNSVGVLDGSVGMGNGRVNARIVNNDFDGNFGVDTVIESIIATADPSSGAEWDIDTYNTSGFESDPKARLNLVYRDNAGNGQDVSRPAAVYGNFDDNFHSRDGAPTDGPPSGPFNSGGRLRNAQVTAKREGVEVGGLRTGTPFSIALPDPLISPDLGQHDYDGIGSYSTFVVELGFDTSAGAGGPLMVDTSINTANAGTYPAGSPNTFPGALVTINDSNHEFTSSRSDNFTDTSTGGSDFTIFATRRVDLDDIGIASGSVSHWDFVPNGFFDTAFAFPEPDAVTFPVNQFTPVLPDPGTTNAGQVRFTFTEPVTNVDHDDFRLSRIDPVTGIKAPVDMTGVTVTQISPTTYDIDLSGVTVLDGAYELTLDTTAPTADIINVSPDPILSDAGLITIRFSEDVTGVDLSDFALSRDLQDGNGFINLPLVNPFTGDQLELLQVTPSEYTLDVSSLTDIVGVYRLVLTDTGSNIIDGIGNPLDLGLTDSVEEVWERGNTRPLGDIVDISLDPRAVAVTSARVIFDELVRVGDVDVTDFTLTRNTGGGPIPQTLSGVTVAPDPAFTTTASIGGIPTVVASQFILNNLGAVTAPDGTYRLTLISNGPTPIRDVEANGLSTLQFSAFDDFVVDTAGPTPTITTVFPDPRMGNVATVTFSFDEPVQGVNTANAADHFALTLDRGDGNGPQPVSLFGQTITQTTTTLFSLDLNAVTGEDGTYELTLFRQGNPINAISDGATLRVNANESWVRDSGRPTAEIISIDPDPRIQSAGIVNIQFSELVTGVDLASAETDFNLRIDIGDGNGFLPVSIAGLPVMPLDTQTISGQPFASKYQINLDPVTTTNADYEFEIVDTGAVIDVANNAFDAASPNQDAFNVVPRAPVSGIIDAVIANNPLAVDARERFVVDATPPMVVAGTVTVVPDPRSTSLGVATIRFTEDVQGVTLSDFVLTRDGGNVSLAGLVVNEVTPSEYTLDLNLVTGAPGNYVLSIQGTGSLIVDLAGNPLQTGLIQLATWDVENIGPSASVTVPGPRTTPANDINVTFTKPVQVSDLDPGDFRLERDTGSGFVEVPIVGGSITQDNAGAFDDSFTLDLSAAGLTDVEASYRITLVASASGIVDQAGIELGADAFGTWVLDNTTPTVDIIDIAPDPRTSEVGLVNILFNEGAANVDITDLELRLNGGMVPLGGLTVTQETPRRYTVDLTTVTDMDGNYDLRLLASDITDLAGNPLPVDAGLGLAGVAAQDLWFKGTDVLNPTVDIVDVTSPRTSSAGVVAINFSEDVSGVDITDFQLELDSGMLTLTPDLLSPSPGRADQYLLDLTTLTTPVGTYDLTVLADGSILDTSGNPLLVGDTNTWVNQVFDPSASIQNVDPDPRLRPVGELTITFTQVVTGVDIGDFTLTRDVGTGPRPVSLRNATLTVSPEAPIGSKYLLDLTAATGIDGVYNLTLTAAGSGIESDPGNQPLLSDAFESWTTATTISVNTTADSVDVNPGDGIVADAGGMKSLRAAVMEANALAGDDTILLGATTYTLGLGGVEDLGAAGDLDLLDTTGSLTIRGEGAGQTIIDANGVDRVIQVFAGTNVIIEGVTIRGGQVTGSQDGAGVRVDGGTLVIRDSEIIGNVSFDDAGGISSSGNVTLERVTVANNTASNSGGGIRNTGTLTIIESTIGGSFDLSDPMVPDLRNKAGLSGGGIINLPTGVLTISNSTISGNEADLGQGGGIFSAGTTTLTNVTITANDAASGGGVAITGGNNQFQNTIVAGNTATAAQVDVFDFTNGGGLSTLGNNLIGDNTGSATVFPAGAPNANVDFVGTAAALVDPLLNPLEDNGGPTLTHSIRLGSPAIDAGGAQTAMFDQRGITRDLNGVDIGAFEFGGFFTNSTVDSVDVNPGDGIVADNFGRRTLRAAVMEANALPGANAIMLGTEIYQLGQTELDTVAPTVDIVDVTPDPLDDMMSMNDPVDEITIQFSEPVLNVDISDFVLVYDDGQGGGPVTLSLATATLEQDTVDPTKYVLSDLRTLLENDGLYTLTLNVSDITDFEFNALAEDPATAMGSGIAASEQFTRGQDLFAPTVVLSSPVLDAAMAVQISANPGAITLNFSENVFGLSLSNFTLTYDDLMGGGPIAVALTGATITHPSLLQSIVDLTNVPTQMGLTDLGDYSLVFDGTSTIQDFSGNALATGPVTFNWTVVDDTTPPTADIVDIAPDPRINAVGIVTIQFDEDVMGVDLLNAETDFDLTLDIDGAGGAAPVPVDISGLTVNQVSDSEYEIDLTTVTAPDGDYRLTLTTDGLIEDIAGNDLMPAGGLGINEAAEDTWTIGEDLSEFGDLDITDTSGELMIIGDGAGLSVIDANSIDRVLDIASGVTVLLDGITVTGGSLVGVKDGAGIRSNGTLSIVDTEIALNSGDGNGGGIFSNGMLTVTTSTIRDNTGDFGGGIFNDDGTVTVSNSVFNSNTSLTDGGGIYNDRSATVNLTGTTLNGNMAGRDGAGLYNNDIGTAVIDDSTITRNTAVRDGGGLFSEVAANVTATNSTIAFNQARDGGGIVNQDGLVTLAGVTLSGNTATENGGGLFVTSSGTVNANNTAFSGNAAGVNGGGFVNHGVVNLADVRIVDNTADGSGGGLQNTRTLTLQDVAITGNAAMVDGGGALNSGVGNLTLTSVTLTGNSAGNDGGAVHNSVAASLDVSAATVANNSAGADGGGLYLDSTGAVSIVNTTVSTNTATSGGGIFSESAFTFSNATLSSNVASGDGGGLNNNGGPVTFESATIFANQAGGQGGGIHNQSVFGTVSLKNTIVGRNLATLNVDVSGVQYASGGNNLIGDNSSQATTFPVGNPNGNGDLVGTLGAELDPLLGPLQDNGGDTLTHSLLFGSPARDRGSNVGVLATDQRGFARIFDGDGNGTATVDIGAFESGFITNTFQDTIDVFPGDRSSADGDGNSSLRAAVMEANILPGDDTILLIPGVYTFALAGQAEDDSATGDLDIRDNLTIIGAGVEATIIDASFIDRVFHVHPGTTLELQNLTLQGGLEQNGGGILNQGTLSLDNVRIRNSEADRGGAIYNDSITDTLGMDIVAGDLSLTLNDASPFPAAGPFDIRIGLEEIRVTLVAGNDFTIVRGVNGTTPADHTAGDQVELVHSLSAVNSTITGNHARLAGGGIFNLDELTLTRTTVSLNTTHTHGGGLFNTSNATIVDSTFDSNGAVSTGGGIRNDGTQPGAILNIDGSTISNNFASVNGGGVANTGELTMLNTTVSGNRAGADGGGLFNNVGAAPGTVLITNGTIVENRSDDVGGGISNRYGGTVSVKNSIIAANLADVADDDLIGTFVSLETNFIGDVGSSTGFVNDQNRDQVGNTSSPLDAVFGALADNGGATLTHALLGGSPAIDVGDNSGGDPVDQRDGRRPTDATADIGAFEVQENRISINDIMLAEGGGGSTLFTFTVLLENATAEPITLDFTTIQDTAREGEDFIPQSGTLTFAPGDLTHTIAIEVNGDTTFEGSEQFFIQLSNAVNATLIDDFAVGTILNDDTGISVADVAVAEGDSGDMNTLTFDVTLTVPTVETVFVNYAITDVSTTAGVDYLNSGLTGLLTFLPGETSKTVDVTFVGDVSLEPNETFTLDLTNPIDSAGTPVPIVTPTITGTILNDESSFSIDDVSLPEGNSGQTPFTFTVTLDQPSSSVVTVDVDTVNGTAIGGNDFDVLSTTVTFNPGVTSQPVTVQVNGDTQFETAETFGVRLSNPTKDGNADPNGALLLPPDGTGTIQNDEAPPVEWLITLNAAMDTIEVYKDTGSGPVLFTSTMNLMDAFTVTSDTGAMDDVFTVDFVNGAPIPTNGLTIDAAGEGGGDSLVLINDTVDSVTYTSTAAEDGTISIVDGGTTSVITYQDFEPITDNLDATDRVINLHTFDHQVRLRDDSEIGGNSLVDSNLTGTFESVSFKNPTGSLILNTGDGNNTVTISPLDAGFGGAVPITVNAGDGNDNVDASTFDRAFTLNGDAGDDVLAGGSGDDFINGGAGADSMSGNGGADTIRGHDAVTADDNANDTVDGGAGMDTIDGEGGNDSLSGGDDADMITGNDGNDEVHGGAGNDNISGNAGNDVLNGDGGDDNISGNAGNDVLNGDGGDDVITGDAGMDVIDGGSGMDDVDGGTEDDDVSGGDDNDTVKGGAGNDMVSGGDGNDDVQGGADNDTLAGGGGTDNLDGGTETDRIAETATGTDDITLDDTTITVGGQVDPHFNVEEFVLTGGNLTTVIDARNFNGGNVTMDGGDGNDTLHGSPGDDSQLGGLGNDVINGNGGHDNAVGGGGNDVINGGDGNDNLAGSSGQDVIHGDGDNDTIAGGADSDQIFGDAGEDVLNGGTENDTIMGGLDDDTLQGDAGNDLADGEEGNDFIRGGIGDDTLNGGEGNDNLIGDNDRDLINGEAGNDTALGAAHNDTIIGGTGVDFLDGSGSSDDVLIIDASDAADVFVVQKSGSFTAINQTANLNFSARFRRSENVFLNAMDGDDTLTALDISAAGAFEFHINLGGGNDLVDLSGSNNTALVSFITGGDGTDGVTGGPGRDNIHGDAENDTLNGLGGNDTLVGGDGNDNLIGHNDDDTIEGGAGSDTIIGGSGRDDIRAGAGDDFVRGNGGFDTIRGEGGNDTLYGDQSADTIFGGDGHDKIAGRQGNDDLFGDGGNDTIIGNEGEDAIDGGANLDLIDGGRDNDLVIGGLHNDTLFGGDDDDTVLGAAHNDIVFGNDGNDVVKGQGSSNDTMLGGNGGTDLPEPGDILLTNLPHEIDETFSVPQSILDLLLF